MTICWRHPVLFIQWVAHVKSVVKIVSAPETIRRWKLVFSVKRREPGQVSTMRTGTIHLHQQLIAFPTTFPYGRIPTLTIITISRSKVFSFRIDWNTVNCKLVIKIKTFSDLKSTFYWTFGSTFLVSLRVRIRKQLK